MQLFISFLFLGIASSRGEDKKCFRLTAPVTMPCNNQRSTVRLTETVQLQLVRQVLMFLFSF